jgi:hypothetical protein
MDNECLNSVGTLDLTGPSDWMCGLLKENGLSCRVCQVNYVGNVSFTIATGDATDSFTGTNVTAVFVDLELAGGVDTIVWEAIAATVANFDAGQGADTMTLGGPLSQILLSLGEDDDADVVDVFASQWIQYMEGDVIGPVGPKTTDQLTLSNYYEQDLVYLHRGSPTEKATDAENVFHINITNPTVVQIDILANTLYSVDYLAAESTAVLYARESTITNWEVQVNLPSLANPMYIWLWATQGTNGVLNFNIPEMEGPTYTMDVASPVGPENLGAITLGGLQLKSANTDHLQILSQSVLNVQLTGTPSNYDLVVASPPGTIVDVNALPVTALFVNTTLNIPSSVLLSNRTIITAGTGAISTLDLLFTTQVNYTNGCLTTLPVLQVATNLSNWFTSQLTAVGVNPAAVPNCSFYTYQTNQLNLEAPSVIASGLGGNQTVYQLQASGSLVLYDAVPWTYTTLAGSTLIADTRYQVLLDSKTTALVYSTFSSNIVLSVVCDGNADEFTTWSIGGNVTDQVLNWTDVYCAGAIAHGMFSYFLNTTDRNTTTEINFSKDVSLTLLLNISSQKSNQTVRSFNITSGSLNSAAFHTYGNVSYINKMALSYGSTATQLSVTILDGLNNINLESSPLFNLALADDGKN